MGEYSPSLMNVAEARRVVYFVKKILDEGKPQTDIGVVTPYRRQVFFVTGLAFIITRAVARQTCASGRRGIGAVYNLHSGKLFIRFLRATF